MNVFIRTADFETIFPFEKLSGFVATNHSITGRIICEPSEANSLLSTKILTVILGDIEGCNLGILAEARIERLVLEGIELIADLTVSRVA